MSSGCGWQRPQDCREVDRLPLGVLRSMYLTSDVHHVGMGRHPKTAAHRTNRTDAGSHKDMQEQGVKIQLSRMIISNNLKIILNELEVIYSDLIFYKKEAIVTDFVALNYIGQSSVQ